MHTGIHSHYVDNLERLFPYICAKRRTHAKKTKYFLSPEESVDIITKLLVAENWEELSWYYDLTDSGISPAELCSGEFFLRRQKPRSAHPAGFWKFKHPFAPGFKYVNHSTKEDKVTVNLQIDIDQGGGMVQTGHSAFILIRNEKGLQVLPETVAVYDKEMPSPHIEP